MRKLRVRRPSPALIVACLALFVAMGGTGYAVQRASIGSSQLKRNAVTKTKIKKSAVTTSKIRKDAVTGEKVRESTLGKVPDADKLDGEHAAAFERSSKFIRIGVVTIGNNETKEIYKQGPFTLTAKCELSFGGDLATVLISTTQAHSAFDGEGTEAEGGNTRGDFNPGDGDLRFLAAGNTPGAAGIQAGDDGTAVAPDGTQFVAQLWAGVNLFGQSGQCQFGGLIEQAS